jgi:putative ATPase
MDDALFDAEPIEVPPNNQHVTAPLAARMRPSNLDEVLGQTQVTRKDSPLRVLLSPDDDNKLSATSLILWGPPGSGKTTLAHVISVSTGRSFVELSATSSGVKEVREVIDLARRRFARGVGTVLFIDEIHRFSKSQQDSLLAGVEEGWVTLVAATTENPSVSINSALMSRSLVLPLNPLNDDDILQLLNRALISEKGLKSKYKAEDETLKHISRSSGGDARRALIALETAAAVCDAEQRLNILLADAEVAVQRAALRYDKAGDEHYNVVSAFIKSVRGSDVDAAMHYLARMAESGEDPKFIARRLVILASEDIGLADPNALGMAVAGMQASQFVGWPEARIILAQVATYLALAPKSNSVYNAINLAIEDVKLGNADPVPLHLKDGSLSASRQTGAGKGYKYAHDFEEGVASQQYLPDNLKNKTYYKPGTRGAEQRFADLWERIRKVLRSS